MTTALSLTAFLAVAGSNLSAQSPTSESNPLPHNTDSATSPVSLTSKAPTGLVVREIREIHARIPLPKEWTLLEGSLRDRGVVLATKESISSENDPYTTGLSLTIDRTGAREANQKASDYARNLAGEAREKAGDEASAVTESRSGPIHELRFDFPVETEQSLMMTELLMANDATGTITTIVWQMPKAEASGLSSLRDSILSGIVLDPAN